MIGTVEAVQARDIVESFGGDFHATRVSVFIRFADGSEMDAMMPLPGPQIGDRFAMTLVPA